jgi:hypothetical protein
MVFWFEVPRETRRTKKAKILEHGGNEETEGKNAEATVAFGAFRSRDHAITRSFLRVSGASAVRFAFSDQCYQC